MQTKEVNIDGYIIAGNDRKQANLFMSCPVYNDEGGDYYCCIRLSGVLSQETRIYGIDAEQAVLLATHFIKHLLGDSEFVDMNGHPIIL